MSLSKIVSGIFHPIFIPSLVVLVVISQFTNTLILAVGNDLKNLWSGDPL